MRCLRSRGRRRPGFGACTLEQARAPVRPFSGQALSLDQAAEADLRCRQGEANLIALPRQGRNRHSQRGHIRGVEFRLRARRACGHAQRHPHVRSIAPGRPFPEAIHPLNHRRRRKTATHEGQGQARALPKRAHEAVRIGGPNAFVADPSRRDRKTETIVDHRQGGERHRPPRRLIQAFQLTAQAAISRCGDGELQSQPALTGLQRSPPCARPHPLCRCWNGRRRMLSHGRRASQTRQQNQADAEHGTKH